MDDIMESPLDRLDRFNARDLTASEVADNFVQPQAYEALTVSSNTLIMGPRGSGKTTLLKMLTPEGVERRTRAAQGHAINAPLFSGLFIPIDIQLSDQLETLATSGLPNDLANLGIQTLYAFHAFRCIAKSFSWHCTSSRSHSALTLLTSAEEAAAVEQLSALWQLDVSLPTIGALQQALRARQMVAVTAWNRQLLRKQMGQSFSIDEVDIVDLDTGLKGAVEIIAAASNWSSGTRWAVLFDEVEVAPESMQQHLLSYLRHSDTDILFKVAIAPYMQAYRGLPARSRASAMNDYSVVDLQAASERDIEDFSAAFFAKSASHHTGLDLNIYTTLGPSLLSGSTSKSAKNSYGPDSSQARTFRSLARKDPSFEEYLVKKNLSSQDLLSESSSDIRAPIRKVRQTALVREAYLRDSRLSGRRIQSQVSTGRLYVGAAGIMNLCEGNPRRLAFITPMLLNGLDSKSFVPRAVQVDAVTRTASAFRSFLRGLPISEDLGRALPRGLLSFIDILGRAFHNELMSETFPEDPISSFIVDSHSDDATEELVSRGLNSGALIQLSTGDSRGVHRGSASSDPISSSRGKRFRLSYLLSPGYGLTQRVGRAVSLNALLERARDENSGPDKRALTSLLDRQAGLW
ncbi:ORC-CDC6 family AAA ATPase [Agreia sp. Leaf210]|uniref:ORC-CDC6 family AAA ATPase n=1 Tax=Agreia sp. Leaf210 TaxID=1735682 RepID=UPI000A676BBB|nr:hypothetical protein [Agreia sp. Leaf210]